MSAPRASEIRSPFIASSANQGVVAGRSEPGLDQEAAELVAVQPEGAGLVVDLGAAHVRRRIAFEQSFDIAVAVEAAQRRDATRHGGTHLAVGFHLAGEQLDVCALDVEEADLGFDAPECELAVEAWHAAHHDRHLVFER